MNKREQLEKAVVDTKAACSAADDVYDAAYDDADDADDAWDAAYDAWDKAKDELAEYLKEQQKNE